MSLFYGLLSCFCCLFDIIVSWLLAIAVAAILVVLLRDGEAHLLALVSLLVVELRERILLGVIIVVAMAEGIDGEEDGMAE